MESLVNNSELLIGAEDGYGTETKATSVVARLGVALAADRRLVLHHAWRQEASSALRQEGRADTWQRE